MIEIYKIKEDHPYPWRFRIHFQGTWWEFSGIPNYCKTKHQAAMRAWWRVRWMKYA